MTCINNFEKIYSKNKKSHFLKIIRSKFSKGYSKGEKHGYILGYTTKEKDNEKQYIEEEFMEYDCDEDIEYYFIEDEYCFEELFLKYYNMFVFLVCISLLSC